MTTKVLSLLSLHHPYLISSTPDSFTFLESVLTVDGSVSLIKTGKYSAGNCQSFVSLPSAFVSSCFSPSG